jgi:hypothetical protein
MLLRWTVAAVFRASALNSALIIVVPSAKFANAVRQNFESVAVRTVHESEFIFRESEERVQWNTF